MKVTSMACVQGAWLPDIMPARVLDIGAGTGVLSLMCAQRFRAQIDAVEIEKEAFLQLSENIAESPWPERIRPIHNDIREYASKHHSTYDFIITNPPFYTDQLKSPSAKVNQARHDASLKLNDLAVLLPQLLNPSGITSILLPPVEQVLFKQRAELCDLYAFSELNIKEQENRPVRAIITLFRKRPGRIVTEDLCIRDRSGGYSEQYISLLRPYYLHL